MELKVSVFKDLQSYDSRPIRLEEVLWWIQHDESIRNKTELYRNLALTITRDEANKKVKGSMMPAFSVAVLFNGQGKQTTHVTRVTGLSICDIDHVEPSRMDEVRTKIQQDPHTLLFYQTISGEGFRVIYRYSAEGSPPANAVHYRAAYRKGNAYYASLCDIDYDGQCSNITRLSGMAHDPDAYYNPNAEPFPITDDEAAVANLDPSTEPGKRRKESPSGTHQADAE